MDAKLAAGITTEGSGLLNPFVHHLELETTSEKLKTAFLTIVLLPIRVLIICALLITAWLLACIGLWGLDEEDLQKRPLAGWRRWLRVVAVYPMKLFFYAIGFRIRTRGVQPTRAQAGIYVIAPHSSFFDSFVIAYLGGPSIVGRGDNRDAPIIGKLINYTQPVYVWRDDPDSRQNTIKEIINRAKSEEDWPQILIFPEGTCTNRSCLITFKPGAFYPGVPIQPVCIRYPNKLDTVTWTWEGPSALKLLWLTLTQVHSYCEIEFLPVYNPSEEEKKDPKLFANNVRDVMAKALGVPVLDYTYDDCKLMAKAKEMNLPNPNDLVEVQQLRTRLGLNESRIEEQLIETHAAKKGFQAMNYNNFVNYLNVPANNPNTQHLFHLYDKHSAGVIDFREYLLGVVGITHHHNLLDVIKYGFKIYDSSGVGRLNNIEFTKVLYHTLAMSEYECHELYFCIDIVQTGYITFQNFCAYAAKKAEFAHLFSLSTEEIAKNGGDTKLH
ncbi:lysophosphatidylcholine acyltransferase-like isoform X1 [Atheta coriaria]|uniref:lysophosphatidylcholine acyltransferase-like isoform X1 n=1 Tax=Dalotia coriaria TaxID=877792 RepID=UPI0031F3D482